ncbi:MAG: flagellar hook-associated protein FlgK [Alphaproteobacteria bacterium]|nr:flagellar hook-associated protein FlgK [Alphaproteobacteria bacterium]
MSITAMLNAGLSTLLANQTALRVTSSNIANVNTPGYVRRTVQFETDTAGSQMGGINVASVDRAVNNYLASERLSSASNAGETDIAEKFLDQLQSSLGNVNDGRDPASRWADVTAELTSVANDPSSIVKRSQLLQSLGDFTQGVQTLSDQVQSLRKQADGEITATVERINQLVDQISDLNMPIQRAMLGGDTATPLLDQRDSAVRELASLIEIRYEQGESGRATISTPSGYTLVSQNSSEIRHLEIATPGPETTFPTITVVRKDPKSGAQIGSPAALEPHVSGGKLGALLELRDRTLPDIASEIGTMAAGATEALNAAHNASTTVPPPATLTGRATGLLAGDSLGFTGNTSFAIVSSTGALVRRVDVDFDAGTLSVNGGAATAFGGTIGGFTSALNTALGADGSASFVNGVMTLGATSGNGIAVQQDPADPSDRAGRGFSHAFGLNDLLTATAPSSYATGLSLGDAHGFTAGQQLMFAVRAPDGALGPSLTYTVGGANMSDVVAGLNAAVGATGSFALDTSGQLTFTAVSGGRLEVQRDTTQRGATGQSLSAMFGLGQGAQALQASGFGVRASLAQNPTGFALAQLDMTAASTTGSIVLASADGKGAAALLGAANSATFRAAGSLQGRTASIQDFSSAFVVSLGQRASAASVAADDASALASNVEQRAAATEGVNLDEELAAMMMYQQAYNAGARIMTTAQNLYDALLSILK